MITSISGNYSDTIYAGSIRWTGDGGGIYCSIDSGNYWENIGLFDHYVSSLGINSNNDLIAGTRGHFTLYHGGVYKLPSGTNEWITLKDNDIVTSLVLGLEDEIYIGCSNIDLYYGAIRYSFDGGQNWIIIDSGMGDRNVEKLILGNDNHLYSLSGWGNNMIIHRSNNTVLILQPGINQNKEIITYNYPNPFKGETIIYYTLPTNCYEEVQITIYDLFGNQIKKCIMRNDQLKNNQLKFNALGLASGIYMYQISYGVYHCSRNMILLNKNFNYE
ncbi:MAG: T9SS type A sorting domain-containing protein [Bacteroidales bacterium]|nr:T9SS type A sorting domain-containing protein [Bacteroidales bacterium]